MGVEIKVTHSAIDDLRRLLTLKGIKYFEIDCPEISNKLDCQFYQKDIADMITFTYLDNTFSIIHIKNKNHV